MRSVDAGAEQAANPRAHACAPEQVAVSPPDTCAFFPWPATSRVLQHSSIERGLVIMKVLHNAL